MVPSREDESEWSDLLKIREVICDELDQSRGVEVEKWWSGLGAEEPVHPVTDRGLAVYAPFDDVKEGKATMVVRGKSVSVDVFGAAPANDHPHGTRGVRFLKKGGINVSAGSIFQPDEPVTVSMWVRTPDDVKGLMLLSQWGEEDKEKNVPKTGWNIEVIADGAFEMPLRDHEGTLCNTLMPSETPLNPDAWQHIAIRYSGGQSASSITYFIDGEQRVGRRLRDVKISDRFGEHLADILTLGPEAERGGISDVRIFSRWLVDEEVGLLAKEFAWKNLVSKKPRWSEMTKQERKLAECYYRCNEDKESVNLAYVLGETKARSDYLYARSPTTMVMKEKETPATAHVLIRGEYDQRGEVVRPNTPAILPSMEWDGPRNRLDLARWLVNGKNPLTARVTVNRIWQNLFGTGLVKTSEDFGVMGEKPTHPQLLDWLASELQESGWDVKALIRLIVTSATYRQDSTVRPESLAIDPHNRYLARSARRRLDAEVLRDQALAVAGILDPTMGGPSVKPYQPPGVWKAVAFEVSNTNEFKLDRIDRLHRRSIYTFWKRTAIPPAFAAFDAPSREECAVRRERTNTPLQALVLMNDVQHIEAARKLAEWIISDNPDDSSRELAREAFYRVVRRPATEEDIEDLVELETMVSYLYQGQSEEARQLISVGKLPVDDSLDPVAVAAWTVVVNALLNRDDVINQS